MKLRTLNPACVPSHPRSMRPHNRLRPRDRTGPQSSRPALQAATPKRPPHAIPRGGQTRPASRPRRPRTPSGVARSDIYASMRRLPWAETITPIGKSNAPDNPSPNICPCADKCRAAELYQSTTIPRCKPRSHRTPSAPASTSTCYPCSGLPMPSNSRNVRCCLLRTSITTGSGLAIYGSLARTKSDSETKSHADRAVTFQAGTGYAPARRRDIRTREPHVLLSVAFASRPPPEVSPKTPQSACAPFAPAPSSPICPAPSHGATHSIRSHPHSLIHGQHHPCRRPMGR